MVPTTSVLPHASAKARRRQLATACLAIATWFSVMAVAAAPGADAQGGYPYPSAPDCNESPTDDTGCVADQWGFYQGQCTSWVAWRLNARNGIPFRNDYLGQRWGSANNWDNAARAANLIVDSRPAIGAVAQYEAGYHVAYVEAVNADGSVVLSEMNYDRHNGQRTITVRPGHNVGVVGGWPNAFIHIRDLGSAPTSGFAVGTSRVIDDPAMSGPSQWLIRRVNNYGNDGDYTITQSAGGRSTTTNQATWTFSSLPSGTYRVEVYVPRSEAVATVDYRVYDAGTLERATRVAQQQIYGYTSLGNYTVTGGSLAVRQADNWSPADQYGRYIGWDAVRITRLS